MNASTYEIERLSTMQRRRRPGVVRLLQIPFAGVDELAIDPAEPPTELHIEPTGPSGETALWLDDFFWLGLIQTMPRHSLTVRFAPTPDALLHPVILHQLNMIRRVSPEWRLVGQCYVSDLAGEHRLAQAALSVYHEIRIHDAVRPGSSRTAESLRIEDALERIREVQAANKRTTPLIVCTDPAGWESTSSMPAAQASGRRVPVAAATA